MTDPTHDPMSDLPSDLAGKDSPRTRPDARAGLDADAPVPPRPTGPVARLLDGLSGLCLGLASLALVTLVIVFGWLVFGRYVLNDTPTWVEQLSLLLVIAITFLGSATLVHEDRHLGVTFLRDALPRVPRLVLRIVGDVTLVAFGAVMAVVSSELVAFGWGNRLPMLGLPEGLRSLPATVAGALIATFAAARTVAGVRELLRGEPPDARPVPTTD